MRLAYFLFLFMPILTFAQSDATINTSNDFRKGQFYLSWGYNRSYYAESDIHFTGAGYDFTLHDVDAEDMPETFKWKTYFNLTKLSIPQFNLRLGYYVGKNTAISIGVDHMKYHIIQTQYMKIDGYIDPKYTDMEGYTGHFYNDYILYKPEFMDFHHSNGFNFVRASLEQRAPIWTSKDGKHHFVLNGAASTGLILPWTDWTFFGDRWLNGLYPAGYGFSLTAGMRFEFYKHFFAYVNAQVGWTNLPGIILQRNPNTGTTYSDNGGRASQKIQFQERSWGFGAYIPCKRCSKPKEN
ncbi:MAG: hypothetical protein ACOYLH_10685 [Flavobacteriales bacterium]